MRGGDGKRSISGCKRGVRRFLLGALAAVTAAAAAGPALGGVAPPPPSHIAAPDPAGWWDRVRQGIQDSEYEITWQEATPYPDLDAAWHAVNRAQGLRVYFAADGLRISPRLARGAAWEWRWELTGWGRETEVARAGPPLLRAAGREIVLDRGPVVERFGNGPQGLRFGIELAAPPPGDSASSLLLRFRLGGDVSPRVSPDGSGLTLNAPGGASIGRLAELRARDAAGRALPVRCAARAAAGEREILLEVDDRDAAYPVGIEAVAVLPDWSAEGNQPSAFFGVSLGAAGDLNGDGYGDVVVGAHLFDNGQADEGKAFAYFGSAAGLSTIAAWSAEGNQVDARLGVSVSGAGDVNGDGYGDLIVGAYAYDNGETDEGRAYIYLGSPSGPSVSPVWSAEANQASAFFGVWVAPAGDVNGDGYGDVIVGADFYDNGQNDEGRAYVYHGSAAGPMAAPSWVGESNQASAQYGISVAGAGDVNGDGYGDVIVGAVLYDNGQSNEGAAFVYHGSVGGLAAAPAWIGESNLPSSEYGFSVSGAGDVNGDGYGDVIVGAVLDENGQTDEGRAFAYTGSSGGLSSTPAWIAESDQPGAQFGFAVAAAGDANGDGYGDVIVGAVLHDNDLTDQGRVFLFNGSASGLGAKSSWTADGDQAAAQLGWSVGATDVNGDGFADILAGAPYYDRGQLEEGRAFLFRGGPTGPATQPAWSVAGGQAGALQGAAVAAAGDVNGDAYGDILIGAPGYDNGQADEGRALLYLGGPQGLAVSPTWSLESNQAGGHLGAALSGAGDVNGDGFADVVVGLPGYDNGQADEGRAWLLLGAASVPSASPAWIAEPNQAGASFGAAVGWAGDLNADGYADIVVGAPGYDNGQTDEGAAFVYYGGAAGLRPSPVTLLEGEQAGAAFGTSVAAAFDVDGDGFGDLLVGQPLYDGGEADEGRAAWYRGSAQGLLPAFAWEAEPDQAGAQFGKSVAGGGDVDGDGFADLLIGAPLIDAHVPDVGGAFLYRGSPFGPSLFPDWSTEAIQEGAELGSAVAGAGDVNGDGFADVLLGAPRVDTFGVDGGEAQVFLGSAVGPAPVADWRVESSQPFAEFGSAVASAGDVNGDGYADLLVGAPLLDAGSTDDGAVSLFFGNGGPGRVYRPRQRRADGTTEAAPLGGSGDIQGFRLGLVALAPVGRARVKLEWEVKLAGIPFDGLATGLSPAWVDSGVLGLAMEAAAGSLQADEAYHWRMRVRYHPASAPALVAGPWVTSPWNGRLEGDLRTSAPASGRVPDGGAAPGTPLTVTTAGGGQIALAWGASCSPGDTDYEVYEGVLRSFNSHVPRACGTGGATTFTFTPGSGNRYYLVVPTNPYREGSYGVGQAGGQRPQGAAVCRPQAVAACP